MPKGYAEGPAAEEAERQRDELERGPTRERTETRPAVYGATPDDPRPHFLGWLGDVDPEALFVEGAAWGITVVRQAAPSG